jgi:hypothetical protein
LALATPISTAQTASPPSMPSLSRDFPRDRG